MKCGIFSFSENGKILKEKLGNSLAEFSFREESIKPCIYDSKDEVELAFEECDAIIFIGAAGIATRLIAPYLKDKLTDPAVLVIDELASFVIPIASGHVGGANELAKLLASYLGATPVITTATDVNGLFAIDEFAATNDLQIKNRDNIKRVNKKILLNKPINLAIEDDVVITSKADEILDGELGLIFKPIVVGMGCRKGKSLEELEGFFLSTIAEYKIDIAAVIAIATIDIKRDEAGLVELASKYQLPLVTYSAGELACVEGDFEVSEFVENTVGVSDVSARAAKALGKHGDFLLKKKKENGMTISIFEKYKRITISYE